MLKLVCPPVRGFARGGLRLADDDTVDAAPPSLANALRHSAHAVAFVTVWVAAAYLAWSVVSSVTGFDGSQLPVLGPTGVVVGSLVGLIPGCAVQIVFAGLFVAAITAALVVLTVLAATRSGRLSAVRRVRPPALPLGPRVR